MTMTSVVVGPGSLGASPQAPAAVSAPIAAPVAALMLTPKMYHLQGLDSTSASSPTTGKSYDTLGKGKKSWSVRLGLSRQSQNPDDPGKGWGTISAGSALSRQMIYGEPWLYGTVRSSRSAHEPRLFLTASPAAASGVGPATPQTTPHHVPLSMSTPPPPGSPILVVCSCPEFLGGTTRRLGNCRRCGGHRLAGVPLGGTCRLPPPSSRSRPSLAGILRSSMDDPYDQMRRNRLVEPRSSRARSISPHSPRDSSRPGQGSSRVAKERKERKDRKSSTEATCSRSEWYDTGKDATSSPAPRTPSRTSLSAPIAPIAPIVSIADATPGTGVVSPVAASTGSRFADETTARSRPSFAGASTGDDWLEGRVGARERKRNRPRNDWIVERGPASDNPTTDSRRSILECDVNPYLLLKRQRDEDDLSDDLSDNALEQEDSRSPSSLFDPSKVKCIERIPNRSAVAAIGGQRIRVFNEPREIDEDDEDEDDEDEEEFSPGPTRIPIPKVSPKRPPRRLKEARQTLKSILKRGRIVEGKRKNVLFNVDNVIFAPEKPSEATRLSWARIGRIAGCAGVGKERRRAAGSPELPENGDEEEVEQEREREKEKGREKDKEKDKEKEKEKERERRDVARERKEKREEKERPIVPLQKFITIPNIRDPKIDRTRAREPKVVPTAKVSPLAAPERAKIEKPAGRSSAEGREEAYRKPARDAKPKERVKDRAGEESFGRSSGEKPEAAKGSLADGPIKPEDETELEIEIEELKDRLTGIAVDEKDLILKAEELSRRGCLMRSQSDRSYGRPVVPAGGVLFADTMRLSLGRRSKDSPRAVEPSPLFPEEAGETYGKPSNDADRIEPELVPEQVPERNREEHQEDIQEVQEVSGISEVSGVLEVESVELPERTIKETRKDSPGKLDDNERVEVAKPEAAETRTSPVAAELRASPEAGNEHFRRMRPTSWSPPPGKLKHRFRTSDPGVASGDLDKDYRQDHRRTMSSASTSSWSSVGSQGPATIEVGPSRSTRPEANRVSPERTERSNVCKITVSPRASPLVHRLQIGSNAPKGARRTSILINGDQPSGLEPAPDNRVTISVGGEDSVCNPTVISVNSVEPVAPTKGDCAVENRTLVILDNYRANIVVESVGGERAGRSRTDESDKEREVRAESQIPTNSTKSISSTNSTNPTNCRGDERTEKSRAEKRARSSRCQSKLDDKAERFKDEEGHAGKLPNALSKEALISKLLEDSLRKARENGEILDEDSGEAILKILKQSLLKSKEYESSESTIEAGYSRASSLNSDTDFVSTNLFLEENPYEVIKEPIYEEIPDEPPPLPLSPPPTEDYHPKDRLYFGDVDFYKKNYFGKPNDLGEGGYLSKSPDEFFKKMSTSPDEENIATKFELLSFLMDTKGRSGGAEDEEDDEEDDDVEVEEEEEEEEEDTEGDLEALYEQKETSLGDLSSKSSQISNVSDSSEECNIILNSSPEALKSRSVDIERTDSGVGSESSQASSSRGGVARRWRAGNVASGPGSLLGGVPKVISADTKLCEDCEQRLDPLITDSGVVYAPFVCRKCSKKRAERKEIITEIVETEQKYGRDLQIILEEFHRPMLRAGLLTSEQLSAIFLNVEELLEHNLALAEKLKDAVVFAQESGDEDLLTVDVGKLFLESERMLHAFESYCTRQGGASLLLQNLEKEKELLRIFLKVSQMENTVLRRMNLNSFLMVPVQRVTKYPLLLARLLKATPSVRGDIQEAKKRLKQAQTNIELHLEHMNAEAKDVTSTKLWRRISIIQNGRRPVGEQDMVNIKLRKMAVEVLEWAHEEARFVLEGRLLVAQPTDNNWRRGRTVKLAPVTAMLVANGKPSADYLEFTDDSLFPRQIGVKEATLLLVKEKMGRYSLLREPLYLDKCIVCCETDLEDYFEIQELSSKETFIFKAEDGIRTKRWCRTLQAHAQSLGAWRKRRGALPNIMICGVARN